MAEPQLAIDQALPLPRGDARPGSVRIATDSRIAYVFLEPFFSHHGGYAHAEAIIRHLRKDGWQVDLFAPRYKSDGSPSGIRYRLPKLLGCLIRCALSLHRYDLAYVRYHPLSFGPVLLARALSRPIVLEINGPWYDVFFNWPSLKFLSGLVHWLFRVQIKLADATIGVTPQLAKWANAIAPGRGIHVSNGADAAIFRPGLSRPASIALPERYVSFCSFLSLWQGVDTILAATREPSWPDRVPIVIAGDGPEIGQVHEAANESSDRIIYLGVLQQSEIAATLANASAAIVAVTNLRGRADTGVAPVKLFEAMAVGTPVIATDLPFQREIVREAKCGLIVPPDEPRALAQAIAEMVGSPESSRRMGHAGRQAIEREYSWRSAAEKIGQILDRLLAASKASKRTIEPAWAEKQIPIANVDPIVAAGFGEEWSTFRQGEQELSSEERNAIFRAYFNVFPWGLLPQGGGVGIDLGCGSGRWSLMVAPRVAHLHVLDVSETALAVARLNLASERNISFHLASVNEIPLPPQSLDFAFSLGVLHHVPDTQAAMDSVAQKLKPGAPFLIYLYYAFDNRPVWYRVIWRTIDPLRLVIARLPHPLRFLLSQIIATLVYWPLARFARFVERCGISPTLLPLSWYRDRSFYVMRTDAYDRFGTKLEKRFSQTQITNMLTRAGFHRIRFSESEPYWCAVGIKL